MQLHLLGIRHHGPGSAKSVQKALEEIQPDVILIEGPQELDSLLPYMEEEGLCPPVAALIYNPKNLHQAVYYPFTDFSPEWRTFLFARKNQIPILQMDLPQSLSLGLQEVPEKLAALKELNTNPDEDLEAIAYDPLGYIAELAGYTDRERWWEVMFEQGEGNAIIFESILQIMTALREEIGANERPSTLIREAYMRKILRKAVKDGYQNIAIVCGAWHTPALADWKNYKTKDDNALLKGIPKIKTKATWIPWTYNRIANSSGYGAGVVSPAWYELLYHHRENATIYWMSKVAQLFKEEDLDTSAAHAIEATRLAQTLATIRGFALPGIQELSEAVTTIFSNGYESQLTLIEKKLIIGDKLGEVPASIPIVPLQQDLEKRIKKLKLTKYKKAERLWLKATSNRPKGGLDLRQAFDLEQSQCLHQLNLLGINFGVVDQATGRELSTKNEYWEMEWQPEFAIQIIEAGMWGNTIPQAAVNWVLHQSGKINTLVELSELLQKVLKANLPDAIDELLQELRNIAAVTKDIQHLMQALPSLVYLQRYGDVRNTDLSMVTALLDEMIPRICISLPPASSGIDEEASQALFGLLLEVHKAIKLLDHDEHLSTWISALLSITDMVGVHPQIRGAATRICLDMEIMSVEQVASKLSLELSNANNNISAGHWIEGFLYGSGLLLIHHPTLWQMIDQWVDSLPHHHFQHILPTLRRTFANFSAPERQKMMQLAKTGVISSKNVLQLEMDEKRLTLGLPTLQLILG
jgi:hypothetical protein